MFGLEADEIHKFVVDRQTTRLLDGDKRRRHCYRMASSSNKNTGGNHWFCILEEETTHTSQTLLRYSGR